MEFKAWLEKQLSREIPDNIIAFNFNLYESETEDQFDVQLIGCKEYDLEDEDWACNSDFSTEEDLYSFSADDWEDALKTLIKSVKDYLQSCSTPNKLTTAEYVTAGFVDGDLEVITKK